MKSATSSSERKCAVSVSISAATLEAAEAAGVDISRVFDDALRASTQVARGERWREENRAAIAWHNSLVDHMGGTLHELLADDAV